MFNINKIFSVLVATMLLTACSGTKSMKVSSMKKSDKNLNCQEIMLEVNEAEFYRNSAEKNKNPGVSSLLMPIGYLYTYTSAQQAVNAADSRIDYLNRIYDIMKCDEPTTNVRSASYKMPQVGNPIATTAYVAPHARNVSGGGYHKTPSRRDFVGYSQVQYGTPYYSSDWY